MIAPVRYVWRQLFDTRRLVILTCTLAAIFAVGYGLIDNAEASPSNPGNPQVGSDGNRQVVMEFGGLQRDYLIHQPTGAPSDRKRPAVLVFHGGGGAPRLMVSSTGFNQVADRAGFVVVYPAGVEHSWNDGRGADSKAGARGVDDVAFVSALIDKIVAENNVDPHRVYATGISNGGMFSERLGCRLSRKLAAIAPVAGPLAVPEVPGCAPVTPLSVLEVHGTADSVVLYDGGVVTHTTGRDGKAGTTPVLSVAATQQLWRGKNGCTAPAVAGKLPQRSRDDSLITTEMSNCPNGSKVELYSVKGGGHSWPRYTPTPTSGNPVRQFDASGVIWQFFSKFRR